jgi:hypothetical protein
MLPGEPIASSGTTSTTSILRSPATSLQSTSGVSIRFPAKQKSADDDEGVQNVAEVVVASPQVAEWEGIAQHGAPMSPSVVGGTPMASILLQPTSSSAYTRNRTASDTLIQPVIITPYSPDGSLRTGRTSGTSSSDGASSGGTTDTPSSANPLYAASVQEAIVKHVVWSDDAGYPLCEVRFYAFSAFCRFTHCEKQSHSLSPSLPLSRYTIQAIFIIQINHHLL